MAGHDDHDAVECAADAQMRRGNAAELVNGHRGQLPLVERISQFDSRGRCAAVDGLLPAATAYQAAAGRSRRSRLSHCGRYPRRRSSGQDQVIFDVFIHRSIALEVLFLISFGSYSIWASVSLQMAEMSKGCEGCQFNFNNSQHNKKIIDLCDSASAFF